MNPPMKQSQEEKDESLGNRQTTAVQGGRREDPRDTQNRSGPLKKGTQQKIKTQESERIPITIEERDSIQSEERIREHILDVLWTGDGLKGNKPEEKVPLAKIEGIKVNWQRIISGVKNNGWKCIEPNAITSELNRTMSQLVKKSIKGKLEGDDLIYYLNPTKALGIYDEIGTLELNLDEIYMEVEINLHVAFRDFELQRMEFRLKGTSTEEEIYTAVKTLKEKGHTPLDFKIGSKYMSIYTLATVEAVWNTPAVCKAKGKLIALNSIMNNKEMMSEMIQKIKRDRESIIDYFCVIKKKEELEITQEGTPPIMQETEQTKSQIDDLKPEDILHTVKEETTTWRSEKKGSKNIRNDHILDQPNKKRNESLLDKNFHPRSLKCTGTYQREKDKQHNEPNDRSKEKQARGQIESPPSPVGKNSMTERIKEICLSIQNAPKNLQNHQEQKRQQQEHKQRAPPQPPERTKGN